jgi:hypothetical protein
MESALRYRLDKILEEDRSRLGTPRAAQVLALFYG